MEYAKDNLFEVRYDTKLKKLVIKKVRWRTKVVQYIKRHKLITTILLAFILFSSLNVFMIYTFMEILQKL